MKTKMLMLAAALIALGTGCSTMDKVADSLSGKTLTGSGLIADNRIGIDPETKTPVLKSLVISGDVQTIKEGTNYLNYKQETSSAWYNAENKTSRTTLTITTNKQGNMAETLRYALCMIDKLPPEPPRNHAEPGTSSATATE